MSRFYVTKNSIKGNKIIVSGKEAHHILDVMRLKFLDKVVVFDGTGMEYAGIIKEVRGKSLTIEILEKRAPGREDIHPITLIQAIPKKDKMDYIAEKATELGVSRIIPVITARTIPEWNDSKKSGVVQRWQRIALEAAKQCGRRDIPQIGPVIDFKQAINEINDHGLKLLAALSDKAEKLSDSLKGYTSGKVAVAIGPEGDFTTEEIQAALTCGFKIISLGNLVLKSDTAGLALLAMINYEYSG